MQSLPDKRLTRLIKHDIGKTVVKFCAQFTITKNCMIFPLLRDKDVVVIVQINHLQSCGMTIWLKLENQAKFSNSINL